MLVLVKKRYIVNSYKLEELFFRIILDKSLFYFSDHSTFFFSLNGWLKGNQKIFSPFYRVTMDEVSKKNCGGGDLFGSTVNSIIKP